MDVTNSTHVDEVGGQRRDATTARRYPRQQCRHRQQRTPRRDHHRRALADPHRRQSRRHLLVLPRLRPAHAERRSRASIVNIGSMSGFIVNKPQPQCFYNASKAAVHHLTKSLAAEWGARGVRVNAVAPTYIETPLTAFGSREPGDVRGLAGGRRWAASASPRRSPPSCSFSPPTRRA